VTSVASILCCFRRTRRAGLARAGQPTLSLVALCVVPANWVYAGGPVLDPVDVQATLIKLDLMTHLSFQSIVST
jgi:hypothetical protein